MRDMLQGPGENGGTPTNSFIQSGPAARGGGRRNILTDTLPDTLLETLPDILTDILADSWTDIFTHTPIGPRPTVNLVPSKIARRTLDRLSTKEFCCRFSSLE